MKKISFIILLLLEISCIGKAQYQFLKMYYSTYNEWGWDLLETKDEGFAIVGQTSKNVGDVYFLKTDKFGDTIFTQTYGGGNFDAGYSIKQTSDGSYVISGSTHSFGQGASDIYLIKINNNGDTLWTKTFGGSEEDGGGHVQITTDNGFIISGYTYSYGPHWGNVFLVKTDSLGEFQWQKTPDCGSEGCFGQNLIITSDSNYLISGQTTGNQIFLIKTDQSGNVIWSKIYDFYPQSLIGTVKETLDGGYIIVGTAYYYKDGGNWTSDVLLIKTELSGDTLWTKIYGTNGYGNNIDNTNDGGYIVTGSSGNKIVLFKTDATGKIIWTQSPFLLPVNVGLSVIQALDNDYVITGYTDNSQDKDNIFLTKLNGSENSNLHDYSPMLTGSGKWYVLSNPEGYCTEVYYSGGDTIIDNITYREIVGLGPMYEDTLNRRVYLKLSYPDTVLLWFDFSLKKGDTILLDDVDYGQTILSKKYYVDSVGVINTLKGARKAIYLNGPRRFDRPVWVEELGTIGNLADRLKSPDILNTGELGCFYKDGELIYKSETAIALDTCEINTPHVLDLKKISIAINPNPFDDFLSLEKLPNGLLSIKIYDLLGRLIYMEHVQTMNSHIIKTGDIRSGLYILNICTDEGHIIRNQIIIKR